MKETIMDASQTRLDGKTIRAVIALLIGAIAAILVSTMVTLAIPTLSKDFSVDASTIQWVTTAYLLSMAVAIPTTGWAESRWGGKRAWMGALVIFLAGSVLCACAWDAPSLIVFRVVQGFGGGLIFPLMQTLAVRVAGGAPTPQLMATVSMPMAIGPILGPVIAGIILNWLSWRWLFLVNVPIVAVGLYMSWRFIPADSRGKKRGADRLDAFGLMLLAPALVGVLLGLSKTASDGGANHPDVVIPVIAGIALFVGFAFWALRDGGSPIVDIRLLKLRSLGSASAVLFMSGATLYAAMFLLPLYFQGLQGKSVLAAGLLMIPQGVGALAIRFFAGDLSDRFGARGFTVLSFLVAALATVPFALAGAGTSDWWLGLVMFVRGLGIGAMLIPAMSVAYWDVPPSGVQHATMNTRIAQQVGASFGTAIVAVVLQRGLAGGAEQSFRAAFWWTVAISVAGIIPALVLPSRYGRGSGA